MNFNLTKIVYLSFSRAKLVFPDKYREKGLFPSFSRTVREKQVLDVQNRALSLIYQHSCYHIRP